MDENTYNSEGWLGSPGRGFGPHCVCWAHTCLRIQLGFPGMKHPRLCQSHVWCLRWWLKPLETGWVYLSLCGPLSFGRLAHILNMTRSQEKVNKKLTSLFRPRTDTASHYGLILLVKANHKVIPTHGKSSAHAQEWEELVAISADNLPRSLII